MKSKISELADGELPEHDTSAAFDGLRTSAELRGSWREYMLIGDALRGEKRLGADIAGRVMAAMENEPVILAPRAAPHRGWHGPVLAAAATLAGVAVVAWVALIQPDSRMATPAPTLAKTETPQNPLAQPVRQTTMRDMREYLAAHQAQSGFLQFRGGTENIRTVSGTGKAPAK